MRGAPPSRRATAREAEEVRTLGAAGYVCANRTCEIGLEQATGQPCESVVTLPREAHHPVELIRAALA